MATVNRQKVTEINNFTFVSINKSQKIIFSKLSFVRLFIMKLLSTTKVMFLFTLDLFILIDRNVFVLSIVFTNHLISSVVEIKCIDKSMMIKASETYMYKVNVCM